jgi:hypothetical protein
MAYLLEKPLTVTIAGCNVRLIAMEPWLATEDMEVTLMARWYYPKETLAITTKQRVNGLS